MEQAKMPLLLLVLRQSDAHQLPSLPPILFLFFSTTHLKKSIWLCQVLAVAHRLFIVAYRLSRCGTQAQLLHSMWDLTACGILVPPPGIESASPALQGFLTTGPPGKSLCHPF